MPHSEPWEDANLVICEISKQTNAVKTAVFRILQFLDSYKAKKVFFFFKAGNKMKQTLIYIGKINKIWAEIVGI